MADTDYATHWAEVWSVSHFLEDGQLWGYDPFFMAGHPEGTIFDVDNKLIEVGSWVLNKMGVPLPLAYNVVLVALLLVSPLVIYPAARWLNLGRADALLAQTAGLGLWYLNPAFRWGWLGGTLAFTASVCLALVVLAAAVRLTHPERPIPAAAWPVWMVLGPLLFWLHALTFVLLCLPLVVLTLDRWPILPWRRRAHLLLWPPLVLLINVPWLRTALSFTWARAPSDHFLQGGLPALAADLLGIGAVDGASTVSLLGLRWLVLLFGGWGLWHLAQRNVGGQCLVAGAGLSFLLAYGAVHLPGGGNLQPYRYIRQTMFWATVGVAPGLRAAASAELRFTPRRFQRSAIMLGALFAVLWVSHAAWRFRPPGLGGPAYHRWQGPSAEAKALCSHLQTLPLERGRVLVDDFRVGALLPWCSGAQVIGGHFIMIWTDYGFTNVAIEEFLGASYRDYSVSAWREALAIYNVRWLIVHREWGASDWYTLADWLADHPGQVTTGPRFGPYQLYELKSAVELPFTVTPAPGRLHVTGAPDGPFTLPYHWIPQLLAEPAPVRLDREFVGNDPIPFIRVDPSGHSEFVLCTDYRWRLPLSDTTCR